MSVFLNACRGDPVPYVPVWFMRQAGRYMPEYRSIRARASFLDACKSPDLVVEITLQPVHALGVDAAILFSDILIPVEAMGVAIEFVPGPVIRDPVRTRSQIEALRVPEPRESLHFVLEALRRLQTAVPAHVARIGFCGAPWTLANYMVEGAGAKEFTRLKRLLYEDEATGLLLLEKLARTNAAYLTAQIEAGAQAVQIFDTWAGILDANDYARWALPYVQQMVQHVHATQPQAPVIYFARDVLHALDAVGRAGANVVSLDWRTPIDVARRSLGRDVAVQGNLDPAALFAPWPVLRSRVDDVLARGGGGAHIFNLGHGILPETPVNNVRRVVEYVHEHTSTPTN